MTSVVMLAPTADCSGAVPVFVSDYARGRVVGYDVAVKVYGALVKRSAERGGNSELATTMRVLAFRSMASGRWMAKLAAHARHGEAKKSVRIRIGGHRGRVVLTEPPWNLAYSTLDHWEGEDSERHPSAAVVFLGSHDRAVNTVDARHRDFQVPLASRNGWQESTSATLREHLRVAPDAWLHIVVVHLEGRPPTLTAPAPGSRTRLYTAALPPPSDPEYKEVWRAALEGDNAGR